MAKSKLIKLNKKIEQEVTKKYKKIEKDAAEEFNKVANKFVDNFLTKEEESVEETKERIAKEHKRVF